LGNRGAKRNTIISAVLITCSVLIVILASADVPTTRYVEIRLEDGTISSVAIYLPRVEPIGGALLLHGFSGTKEQLSLLAASLANSGYVAFTPDWRGHGASGGTLSEKNDTIISDAKVLARTIRSMYNLSFSIIGGHSMGGTFAQLISSELRPRALIVVGSGAVPGTLRQALESGTRTLFVAAALDTVASPGSIFESLSLTINSTVIPGATYELGRGSVKVILIEGFDHLTVLYGEAFPRDMLSFLDLKGGVPHLQMVVAPLVAAALWVAALAFMVPVLPLFTSDAATITSSPKSRSLVCAVLYIAAGLFHPFLSFIGLSILGTSSFFIMLFASMAISMGIAKMLRLLRIDAKWPAFDPAALLMGASLGIGFTGGLQLILGRSLIRLVPSTYNIPIAFLAFPIVTTFTVLDTSLLSFFTAFPKWAFGVGTKALVLATSLIVMSLVVPQQAGFFLIFAYVSLPFLALLYAFESILAKQGKRGRCAYLAMFSISVSLLTAGYGARIG